MNKPTPIHNRDWHKENCPCKGQPQPVSVRLEARLKEMPAPSPASKLHYNKPGSQNRKK